MKIQERNADLALKPDLSPNFSVQTLPVESHNVAYQCKGLDHSNNVCEYEVNRLPNEKAIRGKRTF